MVNIPLSKRRSWQFGMGVGVLVALYTGLAAKEFAASYLASQPSVSDLKRAIQLSPGNAEYRSRLGRYQALIAGEPGAAVSNLRTAAALNPHDAGTWLDLAVAQQVAGDSASRRDALEHALRAEPTSPQIAWEAGNFFLVDAGRQDLSSAAEADTDRALGEFRVVIENDNELVAPALRLCWRVRPDAEALLRDVVPPRADSTIEFLNFLMGRHDTEGAIKTWSRLAGLRQKFENRHLFGYVQYLIDARRPDAAFAAWEQTADLLGLSAYLPAADNLIVNGDFSLDVLNGGFDWTYVNRPGVKPVLDAGDFRGGQRSLSLAFEGPGINDAGIQQIIPVRGGATYDFSAYYKAGEFEGAGGPRIVLRDAYSGATVYASGVLTDASYWKEADGKVTTPEATALLRLTIERDPPGLPIRGKLWLDDFELSPETGAGASGNPRSEPSSSSAPGRKGAP